MCYYGLRRWGIGIWGFKGEVGNSQVDKKEQTCGKKIFAGPTKNSGTLKEV